MWLAQSIQLTNKRVILCLCRAKQRSFSMCVLNELDFTNVKLHSLYLNCFSLTCGWLHWYSWPKTSNFVSMQGKIMLFLHVYIKWAWFYKSRIAFLVFKPFFLHVVDQKRVILFLPRDRQRPLFVCVFNVFNFAIVKLHSLHLNCFFFMWLSPSIKMPKKSDSDNIVSSCVY